MFQPACCNLLRFVLAVSPVLFEQTNGFLIIAIASEVKGYLAIPTLTCGSALGEKQRTIFDWP